MTQQAVKEIFIPVDRVPWVWASLLDNSKEAYFITRRSIAQSGKSLRELVKDKFGGDKGLVIGEDLSLRGFYIFVGDMDDTDSS